ncbi:zf-HC2 domain-containing protein [candidate division KSB1 bacterium]|nr:zf-HC2 domain-containing protein [candidate division KSB1 bacterium]
MRHPRIKKKLSEFLDGRLSSKEADFISAHLAHCAECQKLLSSFRQLGRLCERADFRVNPYFAKRVLAHLNARRAEGFWQLFDFLPRPVILTGLVLSIFTLTILGAPLYRLTSDETSSELAVLYADTNDLTPVTDDQALAIVFQTHEIEATGE